MRAKKTKHNKTIREQDKRAGNKGTENRRRPAAIYIRIRGCPFARGAGRQGAGRVDERAQERKRVRPLPSPLRFPVPCSLASLLSARDATTQCNGRCADAALSLAGSGERPPDTPAQRRNGRLRMPHVYRPPAPLLGAVRALLCTSVPPPARCPQTAASPEHVTLSGSCVRACCFHAPLLRGPLGQRGRRRGRPVPLPSVPPPAPPTAMCTVTPHNAQRPLRRCAGAPTHRPTHRPCRPNNNNDHGDCFPVAGKPFRGIRPRRPFLPRQRCLHLVRRDTGVPGAGNSCTFPAGHGAGAAAEGRRTATGQGAAARDAGARG